jgi:sec-independent protein translocase protein TatC
MSEGSTQGEAQDARMTLGQHLEELRVRLFRSMLALILCFGVAWYFQAEIAHWMLWPYRKAAVQVNQELVERYNLELARPENSKRRSDYFLSDEPSDNRLRDPMSERPAMFGIGESFYFVLNNSLYFAFFFGSPFVLWQLWQFVGAGLYRHEKRAILRYFPASVFLFVTGIAFCFFLLIPTGMYFLVTTLPRETVLPIIQLEKYTSFLTTLCLAMGAVFQLPILMIFGARLGLVEPSTYGKYRGHFLLGALLVAGIITPGPDWVSQVMMTAPMVVLYEIGIIVSKLLAKPRAAADGTRP